MTDEIARRGPGRPRKDEVRAERRKKRGGLNAFAGQKLAVKEEFLDRKNFEYRWINDDGGRIQSLTEADDWDLVKDPEKQGKEDVDGEGTVVSKIVGKGEYGQPIRAYLARKPKRFYKEDQAEKRRLSDERMRSIRQGVPQGDGANLGASAYVPEGSINIREG